MLVREHTCGGDVGNGGLELVRPAANDITFAIHHRVIADARDFARNILF
ncbi:hypothetical protein GGI59_002737 [Rhizobium lentis]|uniref:Uncharacterized protein n=1 Tax=Rhizobium lentis TaxID=1138194 RepID=A0A7W8XEV8_9HYPH|nr:hypothetical protein [Rhizobium lentis]MBB5550816.1 hypothetical protein [Rhizobium lentis]MBB5561062.1 hypothetical protein [Rhizobium lentis]MBB5567935.1 hypothetical protein [Rhizobium lentis]